VFLLKVTSTNLAKRIWCTCKPRQQGCSEGGNEAQFSGRRITAGTPKSAKNVASTFFNALILLPKDLRFKHWGAKLASCPGRHLTSLRPCAPVTFDWRQHGSRSHECKHWRCRSIWRKWPMFNSWFSLRNRQENVYDAYYFRGKKFLLVNQKGLPPCCVCSFGERSKHFIEDKNLVIFLMEVARTLGQTKKACSLLGVHLRWKRPKHLLRTWTQGCSRLQ